jgi:protoporphyrinogen oxidase
MGAIAAQLSSGLDEQTLHLREPVERLADGALELASGEAVQAEQIILATEGPAAARLLGNERLDPGSRRVSCLYFAAEVPPTGGAWLYLDGEGNGPINNLCAPSEVAPGYAPPGESLISVSVLGDPSKTLEEDVRRQAKRWFGSSVDTWRHLRTYHIDHAQPQQLAGFMEERRGPLEDQGILVCGDWRETASLHGAMYSGRQAAAAVARRSKAGS